MKVLYVGDVHAKAEDLDECQALVDFIIHIASHERPDLVVFLGDQHHDHAIMHVKVLEFWTKTFKEFRKLKLTHNIQTIALVGNHDQPGDAHDSAHSMMAYGDLVTVIDQPTEVEGLLFLPYMHDKAALIRACKLFDNRVVVCHETFSGSTFENGFYAKDGINPDDLPQKQIVSGHIHLGQEFGKVWYVGAPRWMTVSDANVERSIWLVEHAEDGVIVSKTAYSTSQSCTPIYHYTDIESAPAAINPDAPSAKYVIDIKGSARWVNERKKFWAGKARIRTFVTDKTSPKVSESEGVEKSFGKFCQSFKSKYGTPVEVLAGMVKARIY